MILVVTSEARFDRTPDGAVWTQTQLFYPVWEPYLTVFDEVRVVARVRDMPSVPPDWRRADGPCVSIAAVPYYIGPWQYLLRARGVRRAARQAIGPNDAIIIRGSSPDLNAVEAMLRRSGRPYGIEVVGDPYEAFAPGAVRHPLRGFFRWWFTRLLRRLCRHACAASYVTERTLQERYPCLGRTFHSSDVQIPEAALMAEPRPARHDQHAFTLVTVGTLEQLYKAPDVLIDAVADCVRGGLDLRLVLVGDGQHRPNLEARAAALGIKDRVCFRGWLTAGARVRQELDQADLFVLPSLQEGLPRAMVEAMARALPCIGSTAGGMPELLPAEDLVPPGNRAALAQKIREVASAPERQARMSARNLTKAREFRHDILRERHIAFYRYLREQTEAWLETREDKPSHVGTRPESPLERARPDASDSLPSKPCS
jgi:glycosyltransferase involved in cell wall biosynthesis